jgi:hypothetical protein
MKNETGATLSMPFIAHPRPKQCVLLNLLSESNIRSARVLLRGIPISDMHRKLGIDR